MKKTDLFWQSYLNLEKETLEISKYIYLTDEIIGNNKQNIACHQLNTFSPYIADLLVNCCIQIEAISKELYFDNGGTKKRGDSSLHFDGDCLGLINGKWNTDNKIVFVVSPFFYFTKDENKILKPLYKAYECKKPNWKKAYQAVKHDRYSSLYLGNVKAFIQALAALYLLNIYYRNDSWNTNYDNISKLDYSMGSSIFSVKPPAIDNKLGGEINPIPSESPFVVKYTDEGYKKIKYIQDKEYQALNEYWSKQPELQDQKFQQQLQIELNKNEQNPNKVFLYLKELGKYRLNKNIPSNLPFETRKKLLVESEEWNCCIHLRIVSKKADEIDENNIQKEIDDIGELYGIYIMKLYAPMRWTKIAFTSDICKIYIPD